MPAVSTLDGWNPSGASWRRRKLFGEESGADQEHERESRLGHDEGATQTPPPSAFAGA